MLQGGLFFALLMIQSCNTRTLKAPPILSLVNQAVAVRIERRHKLGKIEAYRHKVREKLGTRTRHSIGFVRTKGTGLAFSRWLGAGVRGFLVMLVIALPTLLLTETNPDSQQMVALIALFAGVLTFVEYKAVYPGLFEFRDARPFNRIRFLMLFATVFCLSMIERGRAEPTTVTELIHAVGALIGLSMDFPLSPVRLATQMTGGDASEAQVFAVRTAAGMAYLISLVSLGVFVVLMRVGSWPRRDRPFNVWVNLPTFDPTSGGDVVDRLARDGRINIAFGFLLPFLIPAVVEVAALGFRPLELTSPQTLIWTLTAWAFLPASLFMRGIAMGRVADMIRERRQSADVSPALSAASSLA